MILRYIINTDEWYPAFMKKVTLTDVARLANVSSSAAGKVLNGGSDQIRVGAEARKRILQAARRLNYRTNMAASILAGGSSKLIGVFLDSFASYRTMRLLQEIERVCAESGYRIMTSFSHDNIAHMKEDYLMLQRYGVSGFICCAHDYPHLRKEVRALFAEADNVVFMEKSCLPGKPYVRTSRLRALTEMIADAGRRGFRRFGTMHDWHAAPTEQTLRREFLQALLANGLEANEKLIFEYPKSIRDPGVRARLAMEKMILPQRPDFLYIDDALYAASVQSLLLKQGIPMMIHGGNGEPLFEGLGIESFDPGYEKIASALLYLLLHPGHRTEHLLIEAKYRKKREKRREER